MSALSTGGDTPWNQKQLQILSGAEQVFMESGFEGASVNEIAQRAGVSKATLYNHFPTKEEMFVACVRQRVWQVVETMGDSLMGESVTVSKGSIERQLAELGERWLTLTMDPTVIAFFRMVIAEALRQPSLAQLLYKRGPKVVDEQLAMLLGKAAELGDLIMDDPLVAAQQFFSLCKCETETRLFFCMTEGFSSVELHNFVSKAVRTFMRAYGAKQPA